MKDLINRENKPMYLNISENNINCSFQTNSYVIMFGYKKGQMLIWKHLSFFIDNLSGNITLPKINLFMQLSFIFF